LSLTKLDDQELYSLSNTFISNNNMNNFKNEKSSELSDTKLSNSNIDKKIQSISKDKKISTKNKSNKSKNNNDELFKNKLIKKIENKDSECNKSVSIKEELSK